MSVAELAAAEAVHRLQGRFAPVVTQERCPTQQALARVLAETAVARHDVPGCDNAAMDGYAVRAVDTLSNTAPGATLRVIGRALAGHPLPQSAGPGEAVRIMTGAPLPEGTDAVVMLEDVHAGPDAVVIGAAVERGLNVRPRGEHLRAGQAALPAGRRLRSWDLGLATVAGLDTLAVFRPLRVGVLSTGDELLDPAQPLAASQQYDGNRPMLRAALMRRGFEVVDLGIVSDRADALDRTLRTAAALGLDAVLSSGGVAQGDADLVRRLPGLEFLPLALRPGRGLVGGHIEIAGRKLAYFGLPGNPVAAFLMYQLVVVPLLDRLGGATAEEPLIVRLPLATEARTRAGRVDWRRGRIEATPAGPRVALLALQGSSMLRSLSEADALVGIGPQPETLAGDLVDVIPLATLD